ncbi:hypothetical protein BXP70_26695 [Hymenobacter crusticola]|uniref:Molybdenum ABC transporter permease n=1 Tax=Hymenobacter crusticola TaxID=1770526 RepID=A0A243W6C9_9BACT|nr:hypothetical protein BXP70_26695 [Hymenobacter crusticola]
MFGILVALSGFILRYFMNRRAFNRRNAAGIEEFRSFEQATGSKLLESIGRLVGLVLIIGGFGLTLLSYMTRH